MNAPMLPINPKLLLKKERILWAAIGIIGHLMSYRMLRGFTGKPTDDGYFSPEEKAEIKARGVQNALPVMHHNFT